MKKKLNLLKPEEMITVKGGRLFCGCGSACGGCLRGKYRSRPKAQKVHRSVI